jgi:hypothetical protein
MEVLELLQQIEKQQLFLAKNNKDRSSLEKIDHLLEIVDESISGLASKDDKMVREMLSLKVAINRMIDDISIALEYYNNSCGNNNNNRISFEVTGKQYSDLIKWERSIEDRLFRYQVETGMMWPGSDDVVCESILETFRVIAKEGGDTIRPYYGAIGGAYIYKLCPTSLGLITKVENSVTHEEIDITQYGTW